MTQFRMHKGLRVFGEAGTKAVINELQQLHERNIIQPCKADRLSTHEKDNALEYVMFLKQKRHVKFKGMQMGGSHGITDPKRMRSPTVAFMLASLLILCDSRYFLT